MINFDDGTLLTDICEQVWGKNRYNRIKTVLNTYKLWYLVDECIHPSTGNITKIVPREHVGQIKSKCTEHKIKFSHSKNVATKIDPRVYVHHLFPDGLINDNYIVKVGFTKHKDSRNRIDETICGKNKVRVLAEYDKSSKKEEELLHMILKTSGWETYSNEGYLVSKNRIDEFLKHINDYFEVCHRTKST